jgi:hypothetical protein
MQNSTGCKSCQGIHNIFSKVERTPNPMVPPFRVQCPSCGAAISGKDVKPDPFLLSPVYSTLRTLEKLTQEMRMAFLCGGLTPERLQHIGEQIVNAGTRLAEHEEEVQASVA